MAAAGAVRRLWCEQAVPCKVPAFLHRWQEQVVLTGLHLRVLHSLPAPLNRLASGLANIAADESMSSRQDSGEPEALLLLLLSAASMRKHWSGEQVPFAKHAMWKDRP